ncbi:MAG TPA: EAL domain-containing protein [Caulobacteraceae bacterium]|nr:EAL domain-containing protein [Caulobacteraceae bacterium]
MFHRLQTKLSVLFGALFAVMLVLLAAAAYVAITGNVRTAARSQLQADGAVFDRIWQIRSQHLQDSANLLAHDFGFRAAVATHDGATIQSALDNLRQRLGLDKAFIVDLDGTVTGLDVRQIDDGADPLWQALASQDNASGAVMLNGAPYQAISAPVLAPGPVGWVVFATKLDRTEMKSLEGLSAAPVNADLMIKHGPAPWRALDLTVAPGASVDGFARLALAAGGRALPLRLTSGPALAVVKPLKGLDADTQVGLLLSYPLAKAMAPYQPMLWAIAALGLLSLGLLLVGSGLLAASLTKPLAALDEAAQRIAHGEDARVEVVSSDEVGRLALSFNRMAEEIGERERRITQLGLQDSETQLPNRRAMIQRLEALAAQSPGEGVVVSAALGVERFTMVRSAIGYGLVGALLRELGARIVEHDADLTPTRIATSTLGVAFLARDAEHAGHVLTRLVEALQRPVDLGHATVDVGLTCGYAIDGVHAHGAVALLERSNIALDQARDLRRGLAAFDEAAYGDPASNLNLMSEMLKAARDGGLSLHYQPKIDLRSGRVSGAEALARWRHATRGPLSPDLFVGMAEETGHIRALTDWALDRAIADQARLRRAGHDLPLSVNISGRLISDRDFAERAVRKVADHRANLCFEITETAVIDNPALALELIEDYARAGIPISIDDYGSGLSSLAYLKQIAAQELKIDKSFVLGLGADQRDALLIKSTVDLAHALGLKVVAEGVETAECAALLQAMGCDVGQGYYFARPAAMDAFVDFLDAGGVQAAAQRLA